MSKAKNQGTRFETARKRLHNAAGLAADRLAEGGGKDEGDVWIVVPPADDENGVGWVDECKARANLNPHRTLHHAIGKAGHMRVFVTHKRLTRKEGNERRTPDGEPEVVCMHPKTAEALLLAYEVLRAHAPGTIDSIWETVE